MRHIRNIPVYSAFALAVGVVTFAESRAATDIDFSSAHFNLGMAYYRDGKTDEAIRELKQAVSVNPKLTHGYLNLGIVYSKIGDVQDAISAFRKAVETNPALFAARFNLGTKVGLLRLIYFLPYITPMIASAVVVRSLFSPQEHSIANRVLAAFGSKPLGWLFENDSIARVLLQGVFHVRGPDWVDAAFPSLALISVILYNTWVYVGYNTVIFLAGLSTVPKELYEAAALDGAGSWSVLRNVTIPLLSPTIFFLSMMSVIGTFKAFNHIYLMRTAGARGTLDSSSIVIFDEFFKGHNAGYASAQALCLFAVILTLTVLQNRLAGKRVFYG